MASASQAVRGVQKAFLLSILAGFVLGIVVGWIISAYAPPGVQSDTATWLKAFGDIFVRLIRIVIPPLILFTIAAATSSIANARKLGVILLWMLVLYIGTSILAAVWGVLAGQLFTPGTGVGLQPPKDYTPPKPPT